LLSLPPGNLEGTIPDFDKLPNLEKLYLAVNQLKGEIPDFAQCPNLRELSLAYNQLSGSIPSAMGDLDSLTTVILDNNKLNDTIPAVSQ